MTVSQLSLDHERDSMAPTLDELDRHFSEVLGADCEQIRIRNQKTRRGSYSSRTGTLSLDFRLLMGPAGRGLRDWSTSGPTRSTRTTAYASGGSSSSARRAVRKKTSGSGRIGRG